MNNNTTHKLVAGIDVAKNSVCVCCLSEMPKDIKQVLLTYQFLKFEASLEGIKKLLSLDIATAVLEPTGTKYSKIWRSYLEKSNIEVRQVGHKNLKSYRSHLELKNKTDESDALALACYFFEYQNQPFRFVRIKHPLAARLLEIVLKLQHLNRAQNPIINYLRQNLAFQFPEVATTRSVRCTSEVPLLWGWMCGERNSTRYDRLYKNTIGLGLDEFSRCHARHLCEFQGWKYLLKRK
ncbi:MAG: IS110 family transposase [Calothrix sp. SM1_7_51]|nr:IS110 family transposase [Calothrix sp. SM1_7_51]